MNTRKRTLNCSKNFLILFLRDICLPCRRHRFDPWVGKIPWRRKQQPTPVFLLEKSRGQKSLMDYNPWSCKESDTTEKLTRKVK